VADVEDDLAGTPLSVSWTFDLVHDHHLHPSWAIVSGASGSWTPETHDDGSHALELGLTVTDSRDLATTQAFDLYDHEATPLAHLESLSSAAPRLGLALRASAHVDYAVPSGSPLPTLTFDWGDGTSDEFPLLAHQQSVQATHAYAATGAHVLRLIASVGGTSNETSTTIDVRLPSAAVAVFVPLLAERSVTWVEQQAIADRLELDLGTLGREVAVFAWDEQEELVAWMEGYLDDGVIDTLVLMDFAPALAFAGEAEGSLLERWIEARNGLVWTGAAPFAETMGTNGATTAIGSDAVDDLLDASSGVCQGAGPETLTPLASLLLPSLTATSATYAVRTDRIGSAWRVWRLYASGALQESDALLLQHVSGGFYGQFYCVTGSNLPRGAVLAELLALVPLKERSTLGQAR
jgi:hypothetical protein